MPVFYKRMEFRGGWLSDDGENVYLLRNTSDKRESDRLLSLGFTNHHVDFWGQHYQSDCYVGFVPKEEIESAYRSNTEGVVNGERCGIYRYGGDMVEIQVYHENHKLIEEFGPFDLGYGYGRDGGHIEIPDSRVSDIWEERKPYGDYPFVTEPIIWIKKDGKYLIPPQNVESRNNPQTKK